MNTIRILRYVALFEGLSLLLLLFVAMPLKYIMGKPFLVEVVGMAHGILFVAFILLAGLVHVVKKWSFFETTWLVMLSSFIPFGTFYVDHVIFKPADENRSLF